MKLEVKNIKHARFLSEETNAFSADLYADERKIATCSNDGKGGCTNIQPLYSVIEKQRVFYREQLAKAEAFAKTLPGVESQFSKKPLAMNLEFFVDLEVEKDLSKSEVKRVLKSLDKKCLKEIVIISKKALEDFKSGKSLELPHKLLGWKRPIADVPVEIIKKQLPAIKLQLKGDEFIYNTNLPE